VLGRLAAKIDQPVISDEPHVVLACEISVDGREREAAAAIYTEHGDLYAQSQALWIELRST
jgi:hypothetical protein